MLKNQQWHQYATSLWQVVFDMLRGKFNLLCINYTSKMMKAKF